MGNRCFWVCVRTETTFLLSLVQNYSCVAKGLTAFSFPFNNAHVKQPKQTPAPHIEQWSTPCWKDPRLGRSKSHQLLCALLQYDAQMGWEVLWTNSLVRVCGLVYGPTGTVLTNEHKPIYLKLPRALFWTVWYKPGIQCGSFCHESMLILKCLNLAQFWIQTRGNIFQWSLSDTKARGLWLPVRRDGAALWASDLVSVPGSSYLVSVSPSVKRKWYFPPFVNGLRLTNE